ncbi:hypothetical protein JZ751_021277 [Albula glossodonta]|uniref:Uncharacterized protein n=1 Tax=Albula glossodonta TaxID=121402 RepID=A0A8T2MUY0_9TELE|nr:hypothetical protein JZ751_021277 [Albula glossodonta]
MFPQVSSVMSQTIVQKLNGLPEIIPLLQSSTPSVQKTAVSLVGNLSRTPSLQTLRQEMTHMPMQEVTRMTAFRSAAREVLPHLAAIISTGENAKRSADDTLTTACNTFHSLLKVEPELARRVVNDTLVNSLSYLSSNGALPKSGKAASLLLYGLWGEKEIQSILKKSQLWAIAPLRNACAGRGAKGRAKPGRACLCLFVCAPTPAPAKPCVIHPPHPHPTPAPPTPTPPDHPTLPHHPPQCFPGEALKQNSAGIRRNGSMCLQGFVSVREV